MHVPFQPRRPYMPGPGMLGSHCCGVSSHVTLWPLVPGPAGYSKVTVPGAVIVSVFDPVPFADQAYGSVAVKVAVDWPSASAGVSTAHTSAAAGSSLRRILTLRVGEPQGDTPARARRFEPSL